MKKLLFYSLVSAMPYLSVPGSTGQLHAQEVPNRPVEFFIKAHTANRTTIERDSINNRVVSDWVGAVQATPTVIDTLLNTVSTGIDTSKSYKTAPVQTVKYTVTASAGSPNITLQYYIGNRTELDTFDTNTPPPFSRFVLTDSLTITATGSGFWKLTASAQPSGSWCFFRVRGNSGSGTIATKLTGLWWSGEKR